MTLIVCFVRIHVSYFSYTEWQILSISSFYVTTRVFNFSSNDTIEAFKMPSWGVGRWLGVAGAALCQLVVWKIARKFIFLDHDST